MSAPHFVQFSPFCTRASESHVLLPHAIISNLRLILPELPSLLKLNPQMEVV